MGRFELGFETREGGELRRKVWWSGAALAGLNKKRVASLRFATKREGWVGGVLLAAGKGRTNDDKEWFSVRWKGSEF